MTRDSLICSCRSTPLCCRPMRHPIHVLTCSGAWALRGPSAPVRRMARSWHYFDCWRNITLSRGDLRETRLLSVRRFQLRARLGPPWHHRDGSSLTDPTVQISRSGFLKQDSPVMSRHGESEAAATDDGVGARYIAPTSAGFRACDDSATSSRSLRRPDRTSEGSESLVLVLVVWPRSLALRVF